MNRNVARFVWASGIARHILNAPHSSSPRIYTASLCCGCTECQRQRNILASNLRHSYSCHLSMCMYTCALCQYINQCQRLRAPSHLLHYAYIYMFEYAIVYKSRYFFLPFMCGNNAVWMLAKNAVWIWQVETIARGSLRMCGCGPHKTAPCGWLSYSNNM